MTDLEIELNRIKEIMLLHEGKHVISEGAETRNMKAAKHYLYNKFGYDEQQAMKFIGSVKTDIPNSRLAKCKFILGVVRMVCDGQLKDGQTIMSLNKCLKYVASEAHVNEYDNDLNGLSVEEIVNRFSGLARASLEKDKAEVSNVSYNASQSDYKIVKINSFDEAEQYGEYTSWCVTHYDNMYNTYTHDNEGVFYFCLRNGFESEPKEMGEGCPLDSYGLSMIAVSINEDGSVNTITCRWNHDNGGNDNIMTPKELSNVINMNFYDVFKPRTKKEIEEIRQQKINEIIEEMIDYGIGDDDISLLQCCTKIPFDPNNGDVDKRDFYMYTFDDSNDDYSNDFKNVVFNLLDFRETHKLLVNMVFYQIIWRLYDTIKVENDDEKYNLLSTNGNLLSDKWFDRVLKFKDKIFLISTNGKWNLITNSGNLIFDKWYDKISCLPTYGLTNKFIEVQEGKLGNITDDSGNFKFEKWFDKIFSVNSYLIFIRFDGIMHGYDPSTLEMNVPFDIKELLGYYQGAYYKVKLTNGEEYYLSLIDKKFNLIDIGTKKVVKYNPLTNQSEQFKEAKKNSVNEVRYIDASSRFEDTSNASKPYRNDYMDVYNQKPIRRNDSIRVYHGCTLKTALKAAIQGLSGKQWTPRTYSYEMGMNPIGLFVTTDFNKAKDFSTDNNAQVVMEFSVKAYQLDTPVWNGQSTYFGQGSNPKPFKNAKERIIQRREYNNEIEFDKSEDYPEYVRKSWNPAMAARIFMNNEHQALFYGDLNPNMIKRFWVREKKPNAKYISTNDSFVPYTRSQFIHRFKNTEFIENQWYDRDKGEYVYDKRKIDKGDKVFMPNEDFTSIEDLAMRIVQSEKVKFPKSVSIDIEKEKRFCLQGLKYYIKNGDNAALLDYIWPKQLRQLYGDEKFNNEYDTLGQLQNYK